MNIDIRLKLGLVNQYLDDQIQGIVKEAFDDAIRNEALDEIATKLEAIFSVEKTKMILTIQTAYSGVFYSVDDIVNYIDDYAENHLESIMNDYLRDNPLDDIIVNSDGIVVKIIDNDQPNRFFNEEGRELFFNDPSVDSLYTQGIWRRGDRLFYQIPTKQMDDQIILSGLIHQRLLTVIPISGPGYWLWSWQQAVRKGHGDFDFAENYLIDLSSEKMPSDSSLASRNRASWVDGTAFFKFGDTNNIYNLYDAGNYMWGRAMGMSGFSYSEIRFGSRANEFFLDAEADQRAIKKGFFNQ
ncbi:hypothetical protein [Aquimarina aquimarini]|uniref:hypothetical protein n=1 Tax=Aquimarina aquimarini TaxID=1191734 RepID=UPI001F18CF11|nr:hypothetical protein [Aquimarina aquimarini]